MSAECRHAGRKDETMREKICPRTVTIPFIFFQFIVLLLLLWNASGASAASTVIPAATPRTEYNDRKDISKIMSILEGRKVDKRVLNKVADKMPDVDERELHLMSSLCDRITADSGTPAADLAYSLLTALIVLS